MFGINDKVYNDLINYFKSDSAIKKVILFGSRAKGTENENSDIDICIESVGKKGIIAEKIDKIIGIYSCDIVFQDSLNEELSKQIIRDGIEIYKN